VVYEKIAILNEYLVLALITIRSSVVTCDQHLNTPVYIAYTMWVLTVLHYKQDPSVDLVINMS